MHKPGELRADLERRIAEDLVNRLVDDFGVGTPPTLEQAAKAAVKIAMDMACNTVDAAIKEAAPDLLPGAGGLYQELLSFVLTAYSTSKNNSDPGWMTIYRRAVFRLRECGWQGGDEFNLWEKSDV